MARLGKDAGHSIGGHGGNVRGMQDGRGTGGLRKACRRTAVGLALGLVAAAHTSAWAAESTLLVTGKGLQNCRVYTLEGRHAGSGDTGKEIDLVPGKYTVTIGEVERSITIAPGRNILETQPLKVTGKGLQVYYVYALDGKCSGAGFT